MRSLEEPIRKEKQLRTIGFDDAPFHKLQDQFVELAGVVCSATRFEGMLWGTIEKDGLDATDVIIEMLSNSKFREQLNLILTDGITVGGFNVIDLARLAMEMQIPCVAVMRYRPDLDAFYRAMDRVDQIEQRKEMIARAGPIHSIGNYHFQVVGCSPELASVALSRVTDRGDVPESLRLAHLIGAAVKLGQSSNRA